jgi:hypothetical protein
MRLRIFIDTASLIAGRRTVPLTYPFFGLPNWSLYHDSKFNREAFNQYLQRGQEYFQLTGLADCQVIVFPYDYSDVLNNMGVYKGEIANYSLASKQSGKPVIIFFSHDPEFREEEVKDFSNYYVFHTSFLKSKSSERIMVYPSFVNDTLTAYPASEGAESSPSIGFCGFAPPLGLPFSKRYVKESSKLWLYRLRLHRFIRLNYSAAYRAEALSCIIKTKKLQKNIILREFSGFDGRRGMFIGDNDEFYNRIRQEYFSNLNSCNYTLCARGNGNFSIRFYETMCHGKIPVIIDSDSPLPFTGFINWEKHSVIVKENELKDIEGKILQFHFSHSGKELEDVKRGNRKIWEDYLSADGFFSKLHLLMKDDKANK